MLPTEFSVDEEQLEPILIEKDLVQCDVQVNSPKRFFYYHFLLLSLFFEPILVEKDLVQCDVQVNLSKQDFHLSKDIGRSIVKESPTS